MRFTYSMSHVLGKDLSIADTLSQAPVNQGQDLSDLEFEEETAAFACHIACTLPATPMRLEEIRTRQKGDEECALVTKFCEQGWPEKHSIPAVAKPYFHVWNELSYHDGLLLRASQLVILSSLQGDILTKGLEKVIMQCRVCCQH